MTASPLPFEPAIALITAPVDLAQVVASVSHASVGAIASFLGIVREVNDGRIVSGIDYEAYEPMAHREMDAIAREAGQQFPGVRVSIVHRLGTLTVGEASVAIACAHARRAPAADAMRFIIEQLKVRVPIWKREHYTDGEWTWVDPMGVPR